MHAPAGAPAWLQAFAREIEAWSDATKRGPVGLTVYSRFELPSAADYPFAVIGLSDGVGNKFAAISNGTAWFYLDGSAV